MATYYEMSPGNRDMWTNDYGYVIEDTGFCMPGGADEYYRVYRMTRQSDGKVFYTQGAGSRTFASMPTGLIPCPDSRTDSELEPPPETVTTLTTATLPTSRDLSTLVAPTAATTGITSAAPFIDPNLAELTRVQGLLDDCLDKLERLRAVEEDYTELMDALSQRAQSEEYRALWQESEALLETCRENFLRAGEQLTDAMTTRGELETALEAAYARQDELLADLAEARAQPHTTVIDLAPVTEQLEQLNASIDVVEGVVAAVPQLAASFANRPPPEFDIGPVEVEFDPAPLSKLLGRATTIAEQKAQKHSELFKMLAIGLAGFGLVALLKR